VKQRLPKAIGLSPDNTLEIYELLITLLIRNRSFWSS